MGVVIPKPLSGTSVSGAPVLLRILLLGFLCIKAGFAASFFGEHARGWHWYEVLPVTEPEQQIDDKSIVMQIPQEDKEHQKRSHPKTPTELVKAYREVLESRLHAAWVNPTPQNLKAYQEIQKDLMDRSQIFSTVWMQNVFQNPELDHTLVSPVNQQGRHLQIDLEKESTARTIQNLSEEYGLFFFFSGDCPYCHQFAPIVKRFAETYGWEVIAISVDAGAPDRASLAEFPHAQSDNGLFEAWNIKVLPSLFAVNPKTQEAIPIAYGLTSLDEMENRIMTLVSSTAVSPTLMGGKP
jgi:conjugal transfer pilus assembly protein TraF